MTQKVLLIEDDEAIRFGVERYLVQSGFVVDCSSTCSDALERFRSFGPNAVVTDYRLPDGEALELIAAFRRIDRNVPILVLTGYGSIDLAVRAVKQGAVNLLTKPIDLEGLVNELRQHLRPIVTSGVHRTASKSPYFGQSAIMRELRDHAERLRDVDVSTLILGETGTGKTMLGRWLHDSGHRATKPFVDLNCAGLARDLVESELFGHERGAFTSAHAAKPGLFELADGGTIFLDEIGDVDLAVQPKVLKAIEEKRFRRMGSTKERVVDARVIAATHRDLREASMEGAFRADLYFRLSTVTISIPPLRARAADIPQLARDLLDSMCAHLDRSPPELTRDAETTLLTYAWPGNIRELRNVLERALYLAPGSELTSKDLAIGDTRSSLRMPAAPTLDEVERLHIERALAHHGNVGEAAKSLGISRSTMYQKLKVYGIALSRTPARN
jgi:DNA-binding NtrC family response regulator